MGHAFWKARKEAESKEANAKSKEANAKFCNDMLELAGTRVQALRVEKRRIKVMKAERNTDVSELEWLNAEIAEKQLAARLARHEARHPPFRRTESANSNNLYAAYM